MAHHRPNHAWDAAGQGRKDAAAAESVWWSLHRDRVLQVACAILANDDIRPMDHSPTRLIDRARDIVREITQRAEPPD